VVVLLNRHCNEILKMPDVVARMSSIAMTPSGGEPGSLGKLVADEYARYGKLVQEFRITAD
jgi:tripartite-type tricarboxylate transporter receptor subunit TctC